MALNEKFFCDDKMTYLDILSYSMDSIADDLLEAYEEGDLGKGLVALGIHSNAVAKICSREALKCIMKAVCSQYDGFYNHDRLKEVADRTFEHEFTQALLNDSEDERAFNEAIENSIKGRMRQTAIKKLDDYMEDMWKTDKG